MRAILFDYLATFGSSMHGWAERWLAEISTWDDLDGDDERTRHGMEVIDELTQACSSIVQHLTLPPDLSSSPSSTGTGL